MNQEMLAFDSETMAKTVNKLPPMPGVIHELLRVTADETSTAKDVAEVLMTDQALSGKVLKLVNSSFFGFSREISTISRAVVILGNATLRNIAVSFGAYDTVKDYEGPLDYTAFWRHSHCCASIAQILASRLEFKEPEEAFVTGFLHDIGIIAISLAFPGKMETLLADGGETFLADEQRMFGVGHAEVSARILEKWNLSERICSVVRCHHTPETVSMKEIKLELVIMLADALTRVSGNHYIECFDYVSFLKVAKVAGLSPNELRSILEEIETKKENVATFIDIAEQGYETENDSDNNNMETITLIGSDTVRGSWQKAILEYFGYKVASVIQDEMESELRTDLILLDPEGLERPALDKIIKSGKKASTPVALFKETGMDESAFSLLQEHPSIPLIFSQDDIKSLLNEDS